jgi:hypothetical protein
VPTKAAFQHEATNLLVIKTKIQTIKTFMKTLCLLFTILIVTVTHVFGEIKNGYEKGILQTKESLKTYSALLHASRNNLTPYQRRKLEHRIDSLVTVISGYEITASLLEQFKIISPDLYAEIDALKNVNGWNVKVYVKFIEMPTTDTKVWGMTCMSPLGNDDETYASEYGKFTVSIKIWIGNNALVVLAHELGHVKYQVLHFSTYMKYYRENYTLGRDPSYLLGHNIDDLSGKSAARYVARFRRKYGHFLKLKKQKLQSPLILINRVRKNLINTTII